MAEVCVYRAPLFARLGFIHFGGCGFVCKDSVVRLCVVSLTTALLDDGVDFRPHPLSDTYQMIILPLFRVKSWGVGFEV